MIAPSSSLIGLRAAFLAALGLSACTSRPLDDVGSGDLDTTATTDPPATATGAPTTGAPGTTTATTTSGVVTTGAETTTTDATTGTTSGTTTTGPVTGGESDSGSTTTTGVDVSTSGTTDAGTGTTGTPDLPCVSIGSLGTDLMPGDVLEAPGCENVAATDCYDYVKICAPLPDGIASCEQCAPDCIGMLPPTCDAWIRGSAACGPFAEGEQCCQVFEYGWNCTDGRPFCVDGEARVAPAIAGDAWCGQLRTVDGGPALLAELAPHERAGLAALWTADGLAEHASVAAFARFTLQLMALGAPAELVADACRAQLDEVGHARTTLALAAAYGRPVGPGPLAVAGALDASHDREAVLVATFIEGCVGETIAAAELERAAEGCADPAVAAVLRAVAADEQRHAALAWRTVQWLLQEGGGALRGALAQALAGVRAPTPELDTLPAALLRRHGRLPADERVALAEQCLRAVIRPCVAALLGAADERIAA